jgi:hypothetical protein
MRSKKWSGRQDLNLRPPAPQAGTLPSCATPRIFLNCDLDLKYLNLKLTLEER